MLFEETDSKPEDYAYACFHQPNGKFYLRAGKKLGFTSEQIKQGLLTPNIGNTYSGAVPLALSNILDVDEHGDKIFVISYGSGDVSDGFAITVKDEIVERRELAPKTQEIIDDKTYVDYAVYAKFKGKIKM
jgi:hydroxymethylglutaryl-CoA synthase